MTSDVKKSKPLIKFLKKKGLMEKFDTEVKKWNPKSFQKKRYDSIIGSFRFLDTTDGALFWQSVNEEFEWFRFNKKGMPSYRNKKKDANTVN